MTVEKRIDVARRITAMHEGGVMERLQAHRVIREVWTHCPICGIELLHPFTTSPRRTPKEIANG